jgi:hypothetical protein
MILKKRFFLIISMTVMILAAIAVVPIHKRLVPPAAASTSGSPHKRMISAASTARTATPAVHDDDRVMIGANSLARLTAQFWRWVYSIPVGVDPGSDTTGVNCGINQEGDVWFLAGPASGNSSVTCTVPADKTIVSAVYAVIDDYPCPPEFNFQPPPEQSLEEFLLQDDAQFVDGATAMAQLDGRPLRVKRIKSRLFSFTAAASHLVSDPCVTGSPQLGVSDGFFVFIEPLPHGDHILQLSWNGPNSNPVSGTRTVSLKIRSETDRRD